MKDRILLLISFILISTNVVFADTHKTINTHLENWKTPEITKLLKQGKVISMRSMKDHLQSCGKTVEFDGEVYLVELDNGLKAVFKSLPKEDLGDAYAEVAAYQASVALGFPHIPPTVMATIKGMKGSLQLFVETGIDALKPGIYEAALKEASKEDLDNLKLFYFVFGQWDTGPHNILILKDKNKTQLIAIDNSGIRNHQYVKYGNLPFVRVLYSDALKTNDWDKPFPFEQAKTIEHPTTERVRKAFGKTLPESFYHSFKSYRRPFHYVIYRNSLWRQYHAASKNFIKSFACHLPNKTKQAFEGLNLPMLQKIFSCAKNADFLTPSYLQAILERRDQVLRYFTEQRDPS